jgi:uncharacterized membrane protein YkvA (DUF1232 family)
MAGFAYENGSGRTLQGRGPLTISSQIMETVCEAPMQGRRWQDGAPPLDGEVLPPEAAAEQEAFVKASFWDKLKGVVPKIPFAESAVAAFYCAIDPATPTRVKLTLMGALAYFILPVDVVPDFLPLVGFGDDAAVLALAIKLVGDQIKPEHRDRARETLAKLAEPAKRVRNTS